MEENGEIRPWDEMIPEALELIFNELSLREKLNVIPIVCKPWGKVVAERVWKDIDIIDWGKSRNHEDRDRMLQMLINRSTSSLRELCATRYFPSLQTSKLIQRVYLHFIFTSAGNLETLWLPRGQMTTSIVEQVAWKLSTVTNMDLSYCEILPPALEAIGRNCKSLKELHRVMYPPSYGIYYGIYVNSEEETHAIATTMTKLRHLELSYMFLSSECTHEILLSCLELEFFDVRGCYEADFDEELLKKYSEISVLRTPP
ncbi:hypothetical protein GIB67_020129 [Kingdonia uniflora]|uniref:F-box/LRR-repeat protein 23 n=1 Tax=Kingdonia uniflora TaxID=39325 RepID=A0A7J7MIH8_9MAGN|nr:hypothetical protein GIB67_020129 [Kingdonia uniflora]